MGAIYSAAVLSLSLLLILAHRQTPTQSPLIAFSSNRAGTFDLYLYRVDTQAITPLHGNPEVDEKSPSWSPDGRRMVYTVMENGKHDLFILHLADKSVTRLTDHPADDIYPRWSPVGDQIVFSSNRSGSYDLFLLDLPTDELTQLTDDLMLEAYPWWSPRGDALLFHRVDQYNRDIYRLDLETQHITRLTDHIGDDFFPSWSPDGETIAFSSTRNNNTDIFLMAADGGNLRRLTRGADWEAYLSWSPDGQQMVYAASDLGNVDIFLTDETALTIPLTLHQETDYSPSWSPPIQGEWRAWLNIGAVMLAGLGYLLYQFITAQMYLQKG